MTEHAKTQLRRRRKLLAEKRRKIRLFLLALILLFGSGAFLFYKDSLPPLSELMNWYTQNSSSEVLASTHTADRGDIYDRNFRTLAATYKTYAIYARPLEIDNPESTAGILAEILAVEENKLLATLKSERGFIWVAKDIDQKTAETIEQRNIDGVYQVVETKRFYPNLQKAAHVIGFVEDDQGLDGIEFYYNSLLRGDEISREEIKKLNFASASEIENAETHLVLNLDLILQSKIEHFLDKRIKITGASSGSVILMEAGTGAILALSSYPPFNPNRYWEFSSNALNNHTLSEPVYPGELALIFQQAAAINLKNETKHDDAELLEKTDSPTVIIPEKRKRRALSVAPRVDDVDSEYLARFTQLLGFYHKPETDLPLKDETPVTANVALNAPSFNSSALRLLIGFTTLINGGRSVTPHLLYKAFQKNNSSAILSTLNASVQKTVLHPDTTKDLTDFLATKWLKFKKSSRKFAAPMFFESHNFKAPAMETAISESTAELPGKSDSTPYLSQSVMLGAIPGKDPKMTMIVVLSYPNSCDDIYPDALETFGSKFSILNPDQDMIQKMMHVAEMPPPNPSPDFWTDKKTGLAQSSNVISAKSADYALSDDSVKRMPDVTGKSLRAGLQTLQHFSLDIKLVGSGMIISQQPPAGSKLTNSSQCILEMQQEI